MIDLPYFNPGFGSILPKGISYRSQQYTKSNEPFIDFDSGALFEINVPANKEIYLSFDIWDYYKWDSCGFRFNFGDKYLEWQQSGNLKGIEERKVTFSYGYDFMRVNAHFKQEENGLHVSVECPIFVVDKILPGVEFSSFSLRLLTYTNLKNFIFSNKNCFNMVATYLSVDSIEGWDLDSNGNYVLTETGKEGTVRINQESLGKILADYDIYSCMFYADTERKGDLLKSLSFSVDGSTSKVEIPKGNSGIFPALDFKAPSEVKEIKLNVKSD